MNLGLGISIVPVKKEIKPTPQVQYILDLLYHTIVVSHAYSLNRKLKSTYTGKAFQVVRQSDMQTYDVGYLKNGKVDEAGLISFLNGADGRVSILYDNTGHTNLIQTDNAKRPYINVIGTSTLVKSNGKLGLSCANGNHYINTKNSTYFTGYNSLTAITVWDKGSENAVVCSGYGPSASNDDLFAATLHYPSYGYGLYCLGNLSKIDLELGLHLQVDRMSFENANSSFMTTNINGYNNGQAAENEGGDPFDYEGNLIIGNTEVSVGFTGVGCFSEGIYFNNTISDGDLNPLYDNIKDFYNV